MHTSTPFSLEVRPNIPARLARLSELANNLWYSWDLPTRDLFSHIHRSLWDAVGQNPKAFLRNVEERYLIEASEDAVFLDHYNRTLAAYDTYHTKPVRNKHTEGFGDSDLIAYFCAEFGFMKAFRFIPAASAFSPAITANRPVICICPLSAWACFIARVISNRP